MRKESKRYATKKITLKVLFLEALRSTSNDGIFLKDFIYLHFRERGSGEKEKERNINVRERYQLVASHTPLTREPGLQPRHVP